MTRKRDRKFSYYGNSSVTDKPCLICKAITHSNICSACKEQILTITQLEIEKQSPKRYVLQAIEAFNHYINWDHYWTLEARQDSRNQTGMKYRGEF